MPNLRFKHKLNEFDNNLLVFITEQEGKTFPFAEGQLLLMPLEFMYIVPGNLEYPEDLKDATWTANLFPYGEYIAEVEGIRCQVRRIDGDKEHILYSSADKDNFLVAHGIAEDGSEVPLNEFDKVVMQLRVSKIIPDSGLNALLSPAGRIVDNVTICEVKQIE